MIKAIFAAIAIFIASIFGGHQTAVAPSQPAAAVVSNNTTSVSSPTSTGSTPSTTAPVTPSFISAQGSSKSSVHRAPVEQNIAQGIVLGTTTDTSSLNLAQLQAQIAGLQTQISQLLSAQHPSYLSGAPAVQTFGGNTIPSTNELTSGATVGGLHIATTQDISQSNSSNLWTASGSDIYYNGAGVGIGTTTPLSHAGMNSGAGFDDTGDGLLVITGAVPAFYNGEMRGGATLVLNRTSAGRDPAVVEYSTGGAPNWFAGLSYNCGELTPNFTISQGGAINDCTTSHVPEFSIATSGNVGIGTSSPWGNLSVQAPDNSSAPQLVIGSSTATSLFVSNTGNVGIGTTSNLGSFDGLALNMLADSNAGATGFAVGENFSSSGVDLYWVGSGTDPEGLGWGALDTFGNASDLRLNARNVILQDSSGGNVGIGTTSPDAPLTVVGQAATLLHVVNPGFNDARVLIENTDSGDDAALDIKTADFTYSLAVNIDPGRNGFVLSAPNNFDAFHVDPAGNIGASTSTPWRTLSVGGTVGFSGLTGATGAGSLCLDANKQVVYNSGSDNCLSSLRSTKHDINNLTLSGTSTVAALVPVSFIYNNDASSTVRYGFIAEDTAAVDSHFGTYDQSGKLSGVDDRSILSIIVKALQEIIATIAGFAQKFTTKEADVGKLCVTKSDGTPVCITGDQLTSMLASTGQSPSNPVQISTGNFTIVSSSPSSNEGTTTSTTIDTVIIVASSTPPTSPPTNATTSAATSTTQ